MGITSTPNFQHESARLLIRPLSWRVSEVIGSTNIWDLNKYSTVYIPEWMFDTNDPPQILFRHSRSRILARSKL